MPVSKNKRQKVFERDKWKCWYCGCLVTEFAENLKSIKTIATVDHLKPQAVGKDHSLENLVTSCHSCNAIKGKRDLDQFRRYIVSRTCTGKAIAHLQKATELLDKENLFWLLPDAGCISESIKKILTQDSLLKIEIVFHGECKSFDPEKINLDICLSHSAEANDQVFYQSWAELKEGASSNE